jgi:tetratricopeptide (TPR) repeat protein
MEELKFGTVESDQRARGYFEKVIELEPAYSLAYSGMSLTFFNEWSCQLWDRWEISQKGAFEWAKKAIDLDDQNYIAATVLGRVFLYEGEYEKAEHYLRRAIRLNGNDTDNLIEIATSLIFLGYTKEAEELYEKVLQLNPLQQDRYDQVGALVAFESGYYEKCVALGTKVTCGWVDFPALLAAAYYHLGDETRMNHYWATFISDFQARITLSKDAGSEEGLEWIRKISPYKVYTNQEPFWEFLRGNQGKMLFAEELTVSPTTGRASTWMKEADVWKISFDGKTHYIRDMKGMHDLARLLQRPREEIHCSDLLGGVMVSAGKELMFDDKAKRSYQRRIQELEEQLLTVDHDLNPEKKRTLVEEYDQLMDHLSVSLGLGGRTRVTSDTMDRARSAVTWRIRKAIKKIEAVNPSLGKHLSNSVKTGLFCSYHPELSMDWQITS